MTGLVRRATLALVMLIALAGCSTLRLDVPRPPSYALPADPDSPLGRLAGRVGAGSAHGAFRLLESGRAAFAARLALVERARDSLDLQYYIFRNDTSGRLLVEALLRAADRGVRVRVLLDDIDTPENEAAIIGLDAHRNVEVRLYNPFQTRGGTLLGRAAEFLGDASRLNRRMHNKLFLADNQWGITGGRNIGDEYFHVDNTLAFRDLDVMALGPVVREMSAAFDAYWNAEPAVPARALPKTAPRRQLLEDSRASLSAHHGEVSAFLAEYLELDALGGAAVPGLGPWTPGEAEFLLDDPGKIHADADLSTLPVARLLRMGIDARREVLIASPYFVPGAVGTDFIRYLRGRNVDVGILTNSLAANDVRMVHAGYARYRVPLLLAGVRLHELKPLKGPPGVRVKLGRGSSRASLHSKTLVVDRSLAYIGSMNLDPRSIRLNTEAGLLIRGPQLAEQVAQFIEEGMRPEQSYRVRLDPAADLADKKLIWLERHNGVELRHDVEPRTSLGTRMLIDLLTGLPLEEYL